MALILAVIGCRSTLQTTPATGSPAPVVSAGKGQPLALGEGYSCMQNKKGQGQCLGAEGAGSTPATWQVLRAAGSTPVIRHLVARATVSCAVGVKPASLENRVLCWQPQRTRSLPFAEQNSILLSGKFPSPLRSLALQKDKVCALTMDGQVACSDLSTKDAFTLLPVKGLRSILQLRSGESFSCALRGDTGAIFCWGDNSAGQLGLGSSSRSESEPVAIAGFSGFATVMETGSQHACAINSAGEVQCWGSNTDQQLGMEGDKQLEPRVVRGLPAKAAALALGSRHSCAQLVDGSVWCWGAREFLGSDTQGGLIPVRVPLPVASATLISSPDRACSQLTTGEIFCWGIEPEIFVGPP
jgi:alpha-tubulin suppressor-like RCC1 family protein